MSVVSRACRQVYAGLRRTLLPAIRTVVPKPVLQRLEALWDSTKRRIKSLPMFEAHRLDMMIGPIGHWEAMRKYHFDLLKQMGLEPRHTLLDIGCGPLCGGIPFIDYLRAGNYTGIDLRSEVIAEARHQVRKAKLLDKNPVLVQSSSFGHEELDDRKYDYVWASQMLYHLSDEQMENCLREVSSRLSPEGRFYGDIIHAPRRTDENWAGFTFYYRTPEDLQPVAAKFGLIVSDLGKIEDYGYPVDWELKLNPLLEFRKER